jgi:regulator of nonsense transcripts 1
MFVQVKAKVKQCKLHKDSPLGDAMLECYSCASKNVFALGFVPVKVSSRATCESRENAHVIY